MKNGGRILWSVFFLRNIQDLLSDGKTPYERRFGEQCKGPIFSLVRWPNVTRVRQEEEEVVVDVREPRARC